MEAGSAGPQAHCGGTPKEGRAGARVGQLTPQAARTQRLAYPIFSVISWVAALSACPALPRSPTADLCRTRPHIALTDCMFMSQPRRSSPVVNSFQPSPSSSASSARTWASCGLVKCGGGESGKHSV